MNRRGFLFHSALLLGATSRFDRVAAADPPASISFGFSLYGMRSLALDAALAACSQIGYDAVELAVMPDWPGDPRHLTKADRRRLREKLHEYRLALPALMENTPLAGDDATHRQQLDRLKAAAELGHELVPETPPLIETILGGKAGQWDMLKTPFADRLGDWAKIGAETKTVICIKPHRMNAMNLPEQAVWLLERVNSPWIRLAYDWSHFEQRDLKMADTVGTLIPVSRFMHVKDTKVVDGKAQFLLPGDGATDYVALLEQVKAAGYRGCICVEVSGLIHSKKDYDPLAAARHCYAKLAPALEKAGIRRKST